MSFIARRIPIEKRADIGRARPGGRRLRVELRKANGCPAPVCRVFRLCGAEMPCGPLALVELRPYFAKSELRLRALVCVALAVTCGNAQYAFEIGNCARRVFGGKPRRSKRQQHVGRTPVEETCLVQCRQRLLMPSRKAQRARKHQQAPRTGFSGLHQRLDQCCGPVRLAKIDDAMRERCDKAGGPSFPMPRRRDVIGVRECALAVARCDKAFHDRQRVITFGISRACLVRKRMGDRQSGRQCVVAGHM